MTTAQENLAEETSLASRLAAVEAGRAEGLSVAAACRAAGLSTSTYYRRRRRSSPLGCLAGVIGEAPTTELAMERDLLAGDVGTDAEPIAPATGWPFTDDTPRAPSFWDNVFADELTDSYVRRTFGSGQAERRTGHALSALTDPRGGSLGRMAARALRRLGRVRDSAIGLIALGVLGGLAVWSVSSAADPAAWLRPAEFALVSTAPR